MKKQLVFILAGLLLLSFTDDRPAYRIFDAKGKDIKYSRMIRGLGEADVILFGEFHDNPIAHWLQLEVTTDLYRHFRDSLVLGAEMFEADNQLLLDEWLEGKIPESKFEDEARLWKNYRTDYRPLLKFAVDSGLSFVATNIPRRYANLVYRKGFEGLEELSAEARSYIAPLPVAYDPELPGYKAMLDMAGHGGGTMAGMPDMSNLPRAQAIKDATMSHFILENWSDGKVFLHYNGAGHSDNFEGIVWYLHRANPDLRVMTITTRMQADLSELEEESSGSADYTILVPENMTRTF